MKIAFSGNHGTGKTHSAYTEAARLKELHPDKEVGLLTGVERECPLPINGQATFESQMWIFSRQIQEEIRLCQIYDILVCDRTVMDVAAYTAVSAGGGLPGEKAQRMFWLASAWMATYDRVFLKSLRGNDWHADDGVRDRDPAFRNQVAVRLRAMHRKARVNLEEL